MGVSPLRCFLVPQGWRRLANSGNLPRKNDMQAPRKGGAGKMRVNPDVNP